MPDQKIGTASRKSNVKRPSARKPNPKSVPVAKRRGPTHGNKVSQYARQQRAMRSKAQLNIKGNVGTKLAPKASAPKSQAGLNPFAAFPVDPGALIRADANKIKAATSPKKKR